MRRSSNRPSRPWAAESSLGGLPSSVVQALAGLDPIRLTSELLKIRSPTGEEVPCARFLASWLRAQGVRARCRRLSHGRANVEAVVPGRADGPSLLLFGHLDTSFVADTALTHSVLSDAGRTTVARDTPRNGRFVGQDAYNMRAGLAAGATAVAAIQRAGLGLAGSVLFAGLAGESEKVPIRTPMASFTGPAFGGAGWGARRYLKNAPRVDFAVSTGPSDLHVVNGQAGSSFVAIIIRGQAAYLGRRDAVTGSAPLEAAADLIPVLTVWARRYERQAVQDIGLGRIRPRVTIGAIQAGWPFAPVWSPATCRLYLNVRSSPAQSNAMVIAGLSDAVNAFASTRPDLRFELEVYHDTGPGVTPTGTSIVQAAIRAVAEAAGKRPARFPDGFADSTNDTNVFRAAGIPTIQLGPGERRADVAGSAQLIPEVAVADIEMAARIYIHLAMQVCGTGATSADPATGRVVPRSSRWSSAGCAFYLLRPTGQR